MSFDLEKLLSAVDKTGFRLEFEVGVQLKKSGWQLISNRCYVDDHQGAVREIDIVAYKVAKVGEVSLYTVIVISCKKSDANNWALFSRAVESSDPNYDWRPFKGWCNHPAFNYFLKQPLWSQKYHDFMVSECPEILAPPVLDVFAFQEISKSNHTPQNDKNIFSSITSLMKAQAYEMSLLDERKGDKRCFYQFNLVSIIESDLISVRFAEADTTAVAVDSEDYICRYIINKKEERSRIKFVTAQAFSDSIINYDKLHQKNIEYLQELYRDFYSDCYKREKKAKALLPDLIRESRPILNRALFRNRLGARKITELTVSWYETTRSLSIGVVSDDLDLAQVDKLDRDLTLKRELADVLENVFHYDGEFTLEVDIPF